MVGRQAIYGLTLSTKQPKHSHFIVKEIPQNDHTFSMQCLIPPKRVPMTHCFPFSNAYSETLGHFTVIWPTKAMICAHEKMIWRNSPTVRAKVAWCFTWMFFLRRTFFGGFFSLFFRDTPLKFNMEPKNCPVEKDNHLPNLHFGVPC